MLKWLFKAMSLKADINAVKKNKIPQRIARKTIRKRANRYINKLFK